MNIGEKIKNLRLSKMMTQADLAGDQITRNMLCTIERGAALPSLPTACYIAERLNVPVGYLFAEEHEDFDYRKMAAMPNVRRALGAGDYSGCLAVLNAALGDTFDDEIALIRAECEYHVAKAAFDHGRLRAAAAGFDRAVEAAGHTVYDTGWIRTRSAVYFRYLSLLSPTLVSDTLEEVEINTAKSVGDDFCAYILAKEALDGAREGEVNEYLARQGNTVYAARLRALSMMRSGALKEALTAYEQLLSSDALTVGVLMYEVFDDMELCCRQNDDYKRAYEFASSRQGLLERLLEEV
ncbi:MAG: helix-turn-helix transcriptional regulator [Ruminococcaceae bacterium]|nr:helix-turn-helix transcriptional regulator [Oscillospiraceae bacterium]MBQ2757233.1 helix-turn-helix transcriptional regulator [Clostridia bacterium]